MTHYDMEARRILRAAWAVLERSQFRTLKIRQVMLAANTSASNFYRHFPTKAHLLLALLEVETARTDRLLAERIAAADSTPARLRAWLAFNIRTVYHPARAERARLFLDPDLLEELPNQVHRLHEVMGVRLVEVIRAGMAEQVFRSGNPELDAAMVRNLMRGLVANGLLGQLAESEDETVDRAHDFVMRALSPVQVAYPLVI